MPERGIYSASMRGGLSAGDFWNDGGMPAFKRTQVRAPLKRGNHAPSMQNVSGSRNLSEQFEALTRELSRAGKQARLGLAVADEEKVVVRDGFLNQLLDEEKFGRVDDRADALLKGLHGGEGLERSAK